MGLNFENCDPSALYEMFFDAETCSEKKEVLRKLRPVITDKMITDFAISIDHFVEDGSVEDRYLSLLKCLDQISKFESTGLR